MILIINMEFAVETFETGEDHDEDKDEESGEETEDETIDQNENSTDEQI